MPNLGFLILRQFLSTILTSNRPIASKLVVFLINLSIFQFTGNRSNFGRFSCTFRINLSPGLIFLAFWKSLSMISTSKRAMASVIVFFLITGSIRCTSVQFVFNFERILDFFGLGSIFTSFRTDSSAFVVLSLFFFIFAQPVFGCQHCSATRCTCPKMAKIAEIALFRQKSLQTLIFLRYNCKLIFFGLANRVDDLVACCNFSFVILALFFCRQAFSLCRCYFAGHFVDWFDFNRCRAVLFFLDILLALGLIIFLSLLLSLFDLLILIDLCPLILGRRIDDPNLAASYVAGHSVQVILILKIHEEPRSSGIFYWEHLSRQSSVR